MRGKPFSVENLERRRSLKIWGAEDVGEPAKKESHINRRAGNSGEPVIKVNLFSKRT